MSKIDAYIIGHEDSIYNALKKMEDADNICKILFVCNNYNLFYGTITDGDIRRYLISSDDMNISVSHIMNRHPYVSYKDSGKHEDYMSIMKNRVISAIPVLDNQGILVDIITKFDDSDKIMPISLPVVIMAGGKGTRLKPYTNILPKPLIPVGNKTIVERIFDEFIKNGCNEFYMIVNYKKEFIKSYFNEVVSDYSLNYIDEVDFNGTVGGLALCKDYISDTFIMTNCDILIEDNYYKYVEEHRKNKNLVTVVSAEINMQLSYGIVDTDENGQIRKMVEKPQYSFLTNTGFYIIEPQFLELIPEKQFVDMPNLLNDCISQGYKIGAIHIDGKKWMDMGKIDLLEKMRERYE